MKRNIYFIINIIIIILELYAFSRMIIINNTMGLQYYTVISNLLAYIVSLLSLFDYKRKNKYINNLSFIVTCMLTMTFLVVFFVLAPMYNFNYYWLMFKGSNLVMHTLVPTLMINTYLIYNHDRVNKYLPLIITSIYGFIMTILNILKVVDGPYPFLKVYNQPVYMSIIWFISLLTFIYLISIIIVKINKKINNY